MNAACHKPRHVAHVREQKRSHFIGDRAKLRPRILPRVRAPSNDDQLRTVRKRQGARLVQINVTIFAASVLDAVEVHARHAHLQTVRHVTAMVELESHERVARIQKRHIHGNVRRASRVRLHVCVIGTKQLLGAIARERFYGIHMFTSAVIAHTRIPFRVLVREAAPKRFQNSIGCVVFRGNHLQSVLLTSRLLFDEIGNLGVVLLQWRMHGLIHRESENTTRRKKMYTVTQYEDECTKETRYRSDLVNVYDKSVGGAEETRFDCCQFYCGDQRKASGRNQKIPSITYASSRTPSAAEHRSSTRGNGDNNAVSGSFKKRGVKP